MVTSESKIYTIFFKSGNHFNVFAEGIEYDIESDLPKFYNLQTFVPYIDWDCVESIVEGGIK